MRAIPGFLLIAALLGAGCDAPARAPEATATAGSLPIPADFPNQGLTPGDAARQRARDVWVVDTGTVERLLRDDTKRPRHQRFVVRADHGPSLLFAHNIDLAPRVPLRRGDTIAFRGKYVWNEQGGIVHWTHRDRRDRRGGGWIVWRGQNFR